MAQPPYVRCPSCGAGPPNAELMVDGTIYCHPEGKATGGTVRPPSGWYRLPENRKQQDHWDGSVWRGEQRIAEPTTAPFPGVRAVTLAEGEPPAVAETPEIHEDGTKTCPQCAERVQGAALVCRFCGHRFDGQPGVVQSGPPSTSGAAVAAFICSLVGLWIAGLPLGIHAQRQIDQSGGRLTGRGFATTGVVLGILGILGTVILVVVGAAST
jgi:Domain of unknown function (DUF4190)/Uncharacterised protein family UPF0547